MPSPSQVFTQQEARWRLQFLKYVLFQEATPQICVPGFLGVKVTARPVHHVNGELELITSEGRKKKVETYFLQVSGEEWYGRGTAPRHARTRLHTLAHRDAYTR